jgi:putative PIN family toxin of toxin-antitoxin system
MNGWLRFVFDTSTIISAALFEHSKPNQALRKALRDGDLLTSEGTLEELAHVLRRKKFDRYVPLSQRERFLEALIFRSVLIEPNVVVQECRDPDDDKYLELAVAGNSSCLISSDDDLLVMNPFRGIPIVTPTAFLARV